MGPLGSAPLSMLQMCVAGTDAQTRIDLDFQVPPDV